MGQHVTREGVRFYNYTTVDDTVCGARTSGESSACVLEPGHVGQHVTREGIPFNDDGTARDATGRIFHEMEDATGRIFHEMRLMFKVFKETRDKGR